MTSPPRSTAPDGRLSVTTEGAVATVLIDNPRRRNAMTHAMWEAVPAVLEDLAADPAVAVVVLRGAGEHFCAGADITDLEAILDEQRNAGGSLTLAEEALAAFPKATVAAVDGACVGGGWELAGACDLRVATTRARFGVTPARFGILYPFSGVARLVALTGPAVAKRLLLTAEVVAADAALAWGMVSELVPAEGLDAHVADLAALIASRSRLSVRAHKELVDALAGTGGAARSQEVAEVWRRWQREVSTSGEAARGVEAFLARRAPDFLWRAPDGRAVAGAR